MVALRGLFSVASARQLTWVISADIQDHEVVIFDYSDTTTVDDSAAPVIEQLVGIGADENKPCIVMGLSGAAADTLNALDALTRVPEGHFVGSLEEARHLAAQLLHG
jgi:MFS superfamily sulfate permease-like transporter